MTEETCDNVSLLPRVSSNEFHSRYLRQCHHRKSLLLSFTETIGSSILLTRHYFVALDERSYRAFLLSVAEEARDNVKIIIARFFRCPLTEETCDNIKLFSQVSSGVLYRTHLRQYQLIIASSLR